MAYALIVFIVLISTVLTLILKSISTDVVTGRRSRNRAAAERGSSGAPSRPSRKASPTSSAPSSPAITTLRPCLSPPAPSIASGSNCFVSSSLWLSCGKIIYYNFFSWMYDIVGSCAHLTMVNSSWTRAHIEKIWETPDRIKRVYPPCDTSWLQILPLEGRLDTPASISVAQFRPAKAHTLQLKAFAVAIRQLDAGMSKPKLQFVGSCRNKADEERLQNLRNLAVELNVDEDVEFHKNVMYRDLVRLLGNAVARIHSMTDEHFGISVVEYMAAGSIPIAHYSAGPKMDIVLEEDGQQTGFLAQNVDEYGDVILKILKMPKSERFEMASAARRRANRFSEQRFHEDFKAAVQPVLCSSFW